MTLPVMRREREEQRPKNAGVHKDQLKRAATKANRRQAKQQLRGEWR
jgi:hypothetical protein